MIRLDNLIELNIVQILNDKTFWLSTNNKSIDYQKPCMVDIYCDIGEKWNTLTLVSGSSSYYFPYITGGNAGYIDVPNGCKDGTMAITGAMNGCALEVRYSSNKNCYTFYHDANGRSMPPLEDGQKIVCRITADHYWDDCFNEKAKAPGCFATVQFICVYYESKWYVGCSAVLVESRNEGVGITINNVKDSLMPKEGRFKGYFDSNKTLLLDKPRRY